MPATVRFRTINPTLAWVSDASALDPHFHAEFAAAVGDELLLEVDDNPDFGSLHGSEGNTLDAGEAAAGSLSLITIPTLAPGGTYYARLRLTRGALIVYSNTVSKTMQIGSVALTLTDAQTFDQGNSPWTSATPINIGSAFASRRVLVCLLVPNDHDAPPTAIQIGGVAATFITDKGQGATNAALDNQITWAWATVPTGTSAHVTVTGGISAGNGHIEIVAWTFDGSLVTNSAPTVVYGKPTSGTSTTLNLNTAAGGFLIGAHKGDMFGEQTGISITGSTETLETDRVVGNGSGIADRILVSSKKSSTAASTPSSVTWGWTGSGAALVSLLHWK